MASVRDVLNHAGKPVRIEPSSGPPREGKAIRRGLTALVEASLEPAVGDLVVFSETGEAFRVSAATREESGMRVDHYRVVLAPASRG